MKALLRLQQPYRAPLYTPGHGGGMDDAGAMNGQSSCVHT